MTRMKWFSTIPATVQGPIWMVTGGVLLILMAIDIRYLAPRYSILEMIFIRNVITLGFILPWAYRTGISGLATPRFPLHVIRNVTLYMGNLGWFIGVTLVSLADLSALQFTMPLFTVVMAAVILREEVGRRRWSATVTGFAGALIIIRPGFIPIELGTMVVILSALFYASSHITSKKLSATESPKLVLFYMGVVIVPLSLGPALFVWVAPRWEDALPFLLLGVTGANVMASSQSARWSAPTDTSNERSAPLRRAPIFGTEDETAYSAACVRCAWSFSIIRSMAMRARASALSELIATSPRSGSRSMRCCWASMMFLSSV